MRFLGSLVALVRIGPLLAAVVVGIGLPGPAARAAHDHDESSPSKSALQQLTGDTCLVVSAENIVKDDKGNWYIYIQFADKAYTFQKGDALEYDILLPALNPVLKGGVDADLKRDDKLTAELRAMPWIRDCGIVDQNGIKLHGDGVLEPARDKWYHRTFDLSSLAGVTTARWNIAFEGDKPGRYVQFLDNIRITRDGKTVFSLYENGPAPEIALRQTDGYGRNVLITAASREDALKNEATAKFLEKAKKENAMRAQRDQFRAEMQVALELAQRLGDKKLAEEVEKAAASEDKAAFEQGAFEQYFESLHKARHMLGHAHPMMQKFTGHLVGHAHIDLQWLWSWDECVNQIIPQTFGQAVKFMAEFPDFTFSQSSPTLYVATEQHHPELFKKIQEYEKKGQWEIVGGRWCEGDTNMISPESHVRQLLYGQRYFQRKFGHICTVGWEPDTFGHCWTLPQILNKAGIDSYYFCRGADHAGSPAKDLPLFWWEGPDGSKVLAFQEPASGGWYNDVVDDEKVRELAAFVNKTHSFDHLMVYGVGNHGGGPTREYIEAALAMKNRGLWPTIKFSTASEFFKRLHEQAKELQVSTVKSELNPIFEGCYTTHGRIKKYNRDSESLLETAEVFAALAGLHGQKYPRADFESMWRDVCWNHHHDTLPGSFIHASSLYSSEMYEKLLKRGEDILQGSQRELLRHVPWLREGVLAINRPLVVVFNPLAWARSEVVEATVRVPAKERLTAFYDEAGDVPTQIVDRKLDGDMVTLRVCFLARNVPGCGFKVFTNRGTPSKTPEVVTAANIDEIWPRDAARLGTVESPPAELTAKFQVLHEKPHGMSAWTVGEFDKTTPLEKPASVEVLENGPVRRRVRATYRFDKSTITQDAISYPDRPRVDYETTVEWKQVGNNKDGGPMLKVAFAAGIQTEAATYEIPFGDIDRKNNGHENVALKWCDLSDAQHGVTVLNDCKHAYDVKDGVVRLTLLRSSYDPDPTPDVGTHRIRYAAVPHVGALDKAAVARLAWEFNKPMRTVAIDSGDTVAAAVGQSATDGKTNGQDAAPPFAWAGCEADAPNVIVTSLKRAEDNDDFIIRAYECAGKPTKAVFSLGFDAKSAQEVDLLERDMKDAVPVSAAGRKLTAEFKPYEIRTFRVRP